MFCGAGVEVPYFDGCTAGPTHHVQVVQVHTVHLVHNATHSLVTVTKKEEEKCTNHKNKRGVQSNKA